jgi:hypothetical protein
MVERPSEGKQANRGHYTAVKMKVKAMIRQTLNGLVIRGPLRGHNDTPFGRPTPGRPVGRPGGWPPEGRICCF